jgi:uncharacterized protein YqjF (DUF2071 family)
MMGNDIFLTAEWRKLILANYAVDKELLLKYLPPFTELDDWQGQYFISLVGFMFVNTKLRGYGVPFHGNFEEVNLRIYVKYNDGAALKRGVVFIKEIVPKPAITFIANAIYGEKYQTLRMRHHWRVEDDQLKVSYAWKNRSWHDMNVVAGLKSTAIKAGSIEEFITEHYWGYTQIGANKTSEYGVDHPKWEVYPLQDYQINVDFETNYGKDFAFLNQQEPSSVILAEGSEVYVKKGRKLTD